MDNLLLGPVLLLFALPVYFLVQIVRKRPHAQRNLVLSLGALGLAVALLPDDRASQNAAPTASQASAEEQELSEEPISDPDAQTIQWEKAVGCATPELLNEIQRLYERDPEGWALRLAGLMDAGQCRGFDQGDSVRVVDNTWTLKQIRVMDDPRYYWIPMEASKP